MAKLYFRYGAMNSGKTTALMQVAYNYKERGMRVLILKPAIDTKGQDSILSRLGISCKVDQARSHPHMDVVGAGAAPTRPPMARLPACFAMRASFSRPSRPTSCFLSRSIWAFRSSATACGPIS